MSMSTEIRSFCKSIGYQAIADAVGYERKTIYNRASDGRLPPSWFDAVDTLARQQSPPIDVPRKWFWPDAEQAAD